MDSSTPGDDVPRMPTRRCLMLLLWLLALTANAGSEISAGPLPTAGALAAPGAADESAEESVGRVVARTVYVPDVRKEVRHLVFTPSTYNVDEQRRWPLIVGLHGTAGAPEQVMEFPRLQEFAERFGYLVVCPFSSGVGDLPQRYVLDVVDNTRRFFRVDPERIFLMGFSRGGAGVWGLGADYSERWAGLILISPATPSDPAPLDRMHGLPIFVIIGDQDKAVSLRSVRRWARRMDQLSRVHQFVELPGMGHDLSQIQFLPLVFSFIERADSVTKATLGHS